MAESKSTKSGATSVLEELQSEFQAELESFLRRPDLGLDSRMLAECCSYSALAGGKYLRPAIISAYLEMLSPSSELSALPLQLAVELLHCSTLLHDDLPALDDDDFRRGQAAAHKRFGEDVAILAGDALFAVSLQALTEADFESADRTRTALKALGKCYAEICSGQVLDIREDQRESLEQVHRLKTASLFRLCAELSALLAGANEEQTSEMLRFAECFGHLFQQRDDFLDRYRDPNEKGRQVSSDSKNARSTSKGAEAEATAELRRSNEALLSEARRLAPEEPVLMIEILTLLSV